MRAVGREGRADLESLESLAPVDRGTHLEANSLSDEAHVFVVSLQLPNHVDVLHPRAGMADGRLDAMRSSRSCTAGTPVVQESISGYSCTRRKLFLSPLNPCSELSKCVFLFFCRKHLLG